MFAKSLETNQYLVIKNESFKISDPDNVRVKMNFSKILQFSKDVEFNQARRLNLAMNPTISFIQAEF